MRIGSQARLETLQLLPHSRPCLHVQHPGSFTLRQTCIAAQQTSRNTPEI